MKNNNKILEKVIHGIFLILGLITVGAVLLITVYLIISGIPAIREIGLTNFLSVPPGNLLPVNPLSVFSHLFLPAFTALPVPFCWVHQSAFLLLYICPKWQIRL